MVDEDVLVDKLRHVNRYANDFDQMRGMEAEYLDDVVTQRAVERTLMDLIQRARSRGCYRSSSTDDVSWVRSTGSGGSSAAASN